MTPSSNDLVVSLRKRGSDVCVRRVPLIPQENEYEWRPDKLCHEAAEEIERLREALEEIAHIDFRGYPHESARIARKALHRG